MTNHPISFKRNLWPPRRRFWHLSAYGFLALNAILMLTNSRSFSHTAIFLGLSVLLALWCAYLSVSQSIDLGGPLGQRILYFFFGSVLWAGLVSLNPTSLLLIGMFCPLIFTRFSIRRATVIASVQIVGIYVLYALLYQPENWFPLLSIVCGLAIGANLIGYFISDRIACRIS